MKNYLIFIISTFLLCSCESFLDRQPDEAMTLEKAFSKEATTRAYLNEVYFWAPDEYDPSGQQTIYTPCSDEAVVAYQGRIFGYINAGTWTPAHTLIRDYMYDDLWLGIREASVFIENVYKCPELTAEKASQWAAEARFMRAYFYMVLMRYYGPVFILGEKPCDFNDKGLALRERDTWDYCVEWVANEFDKARYDLPESQNSTNYGRPTIGAALALKSRLYLMAARPLFNGCELYRGIISKNGTPLFPQAPDPDKWKRAANAAKAVIDLDKYSLVGADGTNPLVDMKKIFTEINNGEVIWGRLTNGWTWGVSATPVPAKGYGGCGLTQKLVDAFAMKTGLYPITGYTNNGKTPKIDPNSGYSEDAFVSFTHPTIGSTQETLKMYVDREPRFYLNVFWSGLPWRGAGNAAMADVQLYFGGNSGPSATSWNYPPSGYFPHKFIDYSANTSAGNTTAAYWKWKDNAYIRYAGLLLDYVEALNEYNPNDPDIVLYLNKIRKRAGVPDIELVYPSAIGDRIEMRKLILRERNVELCFENDRYHTTRQWMLSETEDNGPVYGMNVNATNDNTNFNTGTFWARTQARNDGSFAANRKFSPKFYLLPIPQHEYDRVNFTQNYGWAN